MPEFFDLTVQHDLSALAIQVDSSGFNCRLIDGEVEYAGFILAKSSTGIKQTICEIDFHKSGHGRHQPRLVFRRTRQSDEGEYQDVPVIDGKDWRRIPFKTGADGYKEFWKMIGFLFRFKDIVDLGEFEGSYQVISGEDFKRYISEKDQITLSSTLDEMTMDSTALLQASAMIRLLSGNKAKLEEFVEINASETDVQNWLDEDDHQYRSERAMIFGLEFIEHKREGGISGNRYDLLTRIGTHAEERVLIELKSPSADIFQTHTRETVNDPVSEYRFSQELSRAIPQILEYKRTLEERHAGDPDLQRIGEEQAVYITKCIIVIGSNQEDPRWRANLRSIREAYNSRLEIWTYTDLVNKLDATIANLKQEPRSVIDETVEDGELTHDMTSGADIPF